jgi:hypothetical protein
MSSPLYEVSILDDTFTEDAYLESVLKLSCRIALNEPTRCAVDLAMDDPKIADCPPMSYIRVMRDSVDLWLGRIQSVGWMDDESNRSSDTYPLDAWDMIAELGTRTLPRPAGMDFNERTGPADDVVKAYVYNEAGPGADVARQINGLTVAVDAGAVGSVTKLWLGGTLLEHVQRLGNEMNFYWGLVPTYAVGGALTGMEFRTAYILWGTDRSKGNPAEIVLAQDNHNVKSIAYKLDLSAHRNHVYVCGPGEDQAQLVVEVDNRAAMALRLGFDPGRREEWTTSDNLTPEGLTADGESYLAQREPVEQLTAVCLPGVIGPGNLGDKITVFDHRYGRSVQKDVVITAISFRLDDSGIETVEPEMVVV